MLQERIDSPLLQTQRLHLKLQDMNLQGMIDELTSTVWRTIYTGEPDRSLGNYHNLREAIEAVLRRHVVSFDVCGLSTICQEATETNPWEEN